MIVRIDDTASYARLIDQEGGGDFLVVFFLHISFINMLDA